MADFALWAAACETALWPAGIIARAYGANRQAIIESVIEADPVAACAHNIMLNRDEWAGTASDFLLAAHKLQRQEAVIRRPDWPRTPRALAGRLRRAQTSLRALGIEIAFCRRRKEPCPLRSSLSRIVSLVTRRRPKNPKVQRLLPIEIRQPEDRETSLTLSGS